LIVVESLSCKLEWSLAQVFAISIPIAMLCYAAACLLAAAVV